MARAKRVSLTADRLDKLQQDRFIEGYNLAKKEILESPSQLQLQQMQQAVQLMEQAGRMMSRIGYMVGKINKENGR